MLLANLPLPVVFLTFLLLLLLVGLSPGWKKMALRIRELIRPGAGAGSGDGSRGTLLPATGGSGLNSYEALVFKRLAQARGKGVSHRQLAAELYLGRVHVKQSLNSLHNRGLLRVAVTRLLGVRFSLSEKGRSYAVTLDLTPHLRPGTSQR